MLKDLCPFNQTWSEEYCWNGIGNNWTDDINWANIPFSKA